MLKMCCREKLITASFWYKEREYGIQNFRKNRLKISRLGFGGIPIQRIDAEGTKKLLHEMVKKGINYIDTARGYTVSEEYMGYAMEGIRDKFVVATKSMARTKDAMRADIETSLGNLRTDYIDLYQVHNPSMEQLEQVMGEDGPCRLFRRQRQREKSGISVLLPTPQLFLKKLWNLTG